MQERFDFYKAMNLEKQRIMLDEKEVYHAEGLSFEYTGMLLARDPMTRGLQVAGPELPHVPPWPPEPVIPVVPPWEPPNNPYLIGWYKFNENGGSTVYNYATDGSAGGGLLPDMTITDAVRGDCWTFKTGFFSVLYAGSPCWQWCMQTFATRTIGGVAAGGGSGMGVFYSRFSGAGGAGGGGKFGWLPETDVYTSHAHYFAVNGFFPPDTDYSVSYTAEAPPDTTTFATPNTVDDWRLWLIASDQYMYRINSNGTASQSPTQISFADVAATQIVMGATSPYAPDPGSRTDGMYGSVADWIIYNNYTPTTTEWAEWYDQLYTRYGMAARSGW